MSTQAGLLVANGVAVLHPKRLLRKYGLDEIDHNAPSTSVKNQMVGLLQAVRYLKGIITSLSFFS